MSKVSFEGEVRKFQRSKFIAAIKLSHDEGSFVTVLSHGDSFNVNLPIIFRNAEEAIKAAREEVKDRQARGFGIRSDSYQSAEIFIAEIVESRRFVFGDYKPNEFGVLESVA